MLRPNVAAFLGHLGRSPVREWLAARDRADGTGRRVMAAVEAAESAVAALGLHSEYRAIEREVDRLVCGVEWFAAASNGAHGITKRDLAAMRLFAVWCALGILTRSQLEPADYQALVAAFFRS